LLDYRGSARRDAADAHCLGAGPLRPRFNTSLRCRRTLRAFYADLALSQLDQTHIDEELVIRFWSDLGPYLWIRFPMKFFIR
jgi:hypothetical protein